MGTLFNQEPREKGLSNDRVISMGFNIKKIADELEVSFKDAIDLYLAAAKIDDYDSGNELMAGFGELMRELIGVCKERKDN